MYKIKYLVLLVMAVTTFFSCSEKVIQSPPKIVFVTGDEEYRSEESMPMLAEILKRELNAEIHICYSVDSLGFIDPNRTDHIANLESLMDADLMIMFTRFRNLPDNERKYITDYAESGKPMVGFRTATHAFMYENDSTKFQFNNDWPTRVFGQQWITHHGHFDDGSGALTAVTVPDDKDQHPILNGVSDFDAYSWLYHVDGGKWKLHGDSYPLLQGRSLKSNHEMNNRLDEYPLTNPVAWTKSYKGANNSINARVFFTTLGHPFDFKNVSMRKLALNGIYWALSIEEQIPSDGVNVEFVNAYEPNNSGFGMKYKQKMKPRQIQ